MLGTVINYCSENPPDAATLALLASQGNSANIQTCGYSTGNRNLPTGATGTPLPAGYGVPASPATYPRYNPAYPNEENCAPLDVACVQRNTARAIAWQQQYGVTQADYNRQQCLDNATSNAASDRGASCFTLWPIGYSGDQPAVNTPIPGDTFLAGGGPPTTVNTTNPPVGPQVASDGSYVYPNGTRGTGCKVVSGLVLCNSVSALPDATAQTQQKQTSSQTVATTGTPAGSNASATLPNLSNTITQVASGLTTTEWMLIGGAGLLLAFMFMKGK